jgi:hypothetical protein
VNTFIYKLIFPNTTKVYVGQSYCPEKRLSRHQQKLRDGIHHSKKLQAEYPECGIPELEILEECSVSEVDTKELAWIAKLNSFYAGYNSAIGGSGTGSGLDSTNCKYCAEDYQAILTFLAYTDMTTKEIAEELSVGQSTVLNISSQAYHTYLKDTMPKEWELMINKQRHHPNWRSYPQVIDPLGTVHSIISARAFSREHKLDQSDFSKLLNGKRSSVRGWKLC